MSKDEFRARMTKAGAHPPHVEFLIDRNMHNIVDQPGPGTSAFKTEANIQARSLNRPIPFPEIEE